jgi:N utilization substance protein A
MIDPVGACVGQRGGRVDRVVTELKGEKIDIIKWSGNPAEFVANALNPAHVLSVYQAKDEKAFRVIVPDNQLSLAIGKEGQNARLAAKLTGWKIDIKSQSQAAEMNDMVDDNGEMTEFIQVETPAYDSFTMDFDDSVGGDDDTM